MELNSQTEKAFRTLTLKHSQRNTAGRIFTMILSVKAQRRMPPALAGEILNRQKTAYVTRDSRRSCRRTDLTSAYGLGLTPDSIDQLKGKEISWEAYADNAPVQQGTLDLSDIYTQLEEYYANQ